MAADETLTPAQRDDLRVIAAMMIPASAEYAVPGADDAAIQADLLATLGRDTAAVCEALDHLARLAGMTLADLDPARREAVASEFRPPADYLRRRSSAWCCNATIATIGCCARWGSSCARRFPRDIRSSRATGRCSSR